MSIANIFLLLPETNPTTKWSTNNLLFQTEEGITDFVAKKVSEINSIAIENYEGYYDMSNIINFLECFEVLEEYYPPKPKRLLLNKIKDWKNWRNEPKQKDTRIYYIFKQAINSHTLSEIAERKQLSPNESFALLNNCALNIQESVIIIDISNNIKIKFDNLKNIQELQKWFSENRIPTRKFHVIPKHGENGVGNRKGASTLMCYKKEAQILLNTAIGVEPKNLFNYDRINNMLIVFWNENEPENQYHGYHVPIDTNEVPQIIKKTLLHK